MNAKKFSSFTPLRSLNDRDSLLLYKDNPCQFLEEQVVIGTNVILPENIDNYYKVGNRILLKLEPFQKKFIDAIILTRDKNGYRYYDEAVLAIGKKNGKSSLASYIATYLFFMDREEESDYIFSSNSKDQADILAFGNFKRICYHSPNLKDKTDRFKSYVQRKNSEIKAYPVPYAEASNHGVMNLAFVSHDEAWGYADDSAYTALTRNFAKNEFLALTTSYAGYNKNSVYYQLYDRCKKANSAKTYFKSYECTIDDPQFWKDANPASWVTLEKLMHQKERLHDNQFKRMHLNMWASSDSSTKMQQFVTEEQVMAVTNPDLAPTEIGGDSDFYVCGVDLGLVHDNTAVAVMHTKGSKLILDRLDVFSGTKENPVDIVKLENYLKELRVRYGCVFVIDPWQMAQTLQKFVTLYGSDVVNEVSFRKVNAELTELLCRVIKTKEIEFYPRAGLHYDQKGNEFTLQQELADLYVKWTNGTIRFDHEYNKKSDMAVAVAICVLKLVGCSQYSPPRIRRL
ncbi:MAG: terminase large subunit domain-containing protein [bacterium]